MVSNHMRLIERVWFAGHPAKYLLLPLLAPFTLLFALLASTRRWLFRVGICKSVKLPKPVLVVGNISVGGNGKTPMVIWLIEQCQQLGLTPGVISRGYGGAYAKTKNAAHSPLLLTESSNAAETGDEPLMIYRRCRVPVVVGADRVACANQLIVLGCDILIADDGLQHYRLARDLELVVIDSKRKFGNSFLLPMGPLREGLWRLKQVDFVIFNGATKQAIEHGNATPLTMQLTGQALVHCGSGERMALADFLTRYPRVNAMAGIGSPERFFATLTALTFELANTQAFVDHHAFQAQDLAGFSADLPLLMTEKDAVKCQTFALPNYWYLPVEAEFVTAEKKLLVERLAQLTRKLNRAKTLNGLTRE